MIVRSHAARAAAAIALAAGITVGMSGCGFFTPTSTLNKYDPSDGVNGSVGEIDILNSFALINEDGHALSILVTFVNNGESRRVVTMQYDTANGREESTATVGGNDRTAFGTNVDADQIIVINPDAVAGGLFPVYFQYGDNEGTQMLLPVLEPNLPEYAELAPPAILR